MNVKTSIDPHTPMQGQTFDRPQEVPMLHRAQELIQGDRQADYGDKLPNFTQIAMLWTGVLAQKLPFGTRITAEDVALCMMQVKIARLAKSPQHADSILDVAGYAGCYDMLQKERESTTGLPNAITHYDQNL